MTKNLTWIAGQLVTTHPTYPLPWIWNKPPSFYICLVLLYVLKQKVVSFVGQNLPVGGFSWWLSLRLTCVHFILRQWKSGQVTLLIER